MNTMIVSMISLFCQLSLKLLRIVMVFSARQHICYSALYAIARLSGRLSVRHTGGSVKDG